MRGKIVTVSKYGTTFTEEEIQKYIIPFNISYRKSHPFSWDAIKYNFLTFTLRVIEFLSSKDVKGLDGGKK